MTLGSEAFNKATDGSLAPFMPHYACAHLNTEGGADRHILPYPEAG